MGSLCEVKAPTTTLPSASMVSSPRPREDMLHTCEPSALTRTTSLVGASAERHERKTASPFGLTESLAPFSLSRFSQRRLPSGSNLTTAAAGVAPSPKSTLPLQPELPHIEAHIR